MTRRVRSVTSNQMGLQSAALAYARNGWRVFPLHAVDGDGRCSCGQEDCEAPGEHPRTPYGVRDATTSEHMIARWWRQEPAANIGIATGRGLLVIKIDPCRGGTLEQLQELYALPETALARLVGGCWYLYYTYANTFVLPNTLERLGDGVDTYGDGGYVIAPPGRHHSGRRHVWLNSLTLAQLPSVLLPALLSSRSLNMGRALLTGVEEPDELLAKQRKPSARPSLLERAAQRTPAELMVSGEKRNESLMHLAATLYEQGTCDDVLRITLMAFNRVQCCPPLPPEEVQRIVKQYAVRRNW